MQKRIVKAALTVLCVIGVTIFLFMLESAQQEKISGAVTAQGGNINQLTLSNQQATASWSSLYGELIEDSSANSSVSVSLSAGTVTEKNITLNCLGDEIYISHSTVSDWNTVNAGTAQEVDEVYGFSGESAESATNIFTTTKNFVVSGQTINLPATHTQVQNSNDQTFDLGILNNSGTIVIVTHNVTDKTGFDGKTHDYQLLVPVNSTSPDYYLFSDCEAGGTDSDNDGFNDTVDFLLGDSNNVKGNFEAYEIIINGSTNTSQLFSGLLNFTITNTTHHIIEFKYNFSAGQTCTVANINLTKQPEGSLVGSLIARGVCMSADQTKTVYVDNIDSSKNHVCVKDEEITDTSEISSDCSEDNEVRVECTSSGTTVSNYTCTDLGGRYKVEGLANSGVIETAAASSAQAPSSSSSSGESVGGGGGSCPPGTELIQGKCTAKDILDDEKSAQIPEPSEPSGESISSIVPGSGDIQNATLQASNIIGRAFGDSEETFTLRVVPIIIIILFMIIFFLLILFAKRRKREEEEQTKISEERKKNKKKRETA